MAYGYDEEQMLLKEPMTIEIGTWAPGSIAPATDPATVFTGGDNLGYMERGSFSQEIVRAFAEFRQGTPSKRIRKDIIQKDLTYVAMLAQINGDLMTLVQGLDTETGAYIIGHIGSDEPAPTTNGFLASTTLVDTTTTFGMGMYSGRVVSENVGISPTGDAHITYEFRAEAEEDAYFVTTPNDLRNYGLEWLST